jgi:protein involved in polysaccharide export with SLBB domain
MIRARIAVLIALVLPIAGYSQSPDAPKDRITVVGNVNKPGVYAAATVMDALKQAGGLGMFKPANVYIYRADDQGAKHEIPVAISGILKRKTPDVKLSPGDILFVPDQKNVKPEQRMGARLILAGLVN